VSKVNNNQTNKNNARLQTLFCNTMMYNNGIELKICYGEAYTIAKVLKVNKT